MSLFRVAASPKGVLLNRLFAPLLICIAAACVDGRGQGHGAAWSGAAAGQAGPNPDFARLIEELSEPGGYFDTDNLISNEKSYLHVVGALDELGVQGGAYVGVGPDQNFSYIAAIRPSVAFIIDIRRDNLLQHLMFKALFSIARNRIEYLCLLFARPPPDDAQDWNDRGVDELVAYVDAAPTDPDAAELAMAAVVNRASNFGLDLSDADRETIRRFHGTFIREGLGLRFRSHGRSPRRNYPTYRQRLLERDLAGRRASYLVDEEDFQFLKSLQDGDRVVPVVGDLAGNHALAAIGRHVAARGERVSAIYVSNVEYYLWRANTYDRFAETVAELPFDGRSVIIRSYFGRNFGYAHPHAVPGYYSVQLLQTFESFVQENSHGGLRSYIDLVTRGAIDLQASVP
jgi:hypothetical protein